MAEVESFFKQTASYDLAESREIVRYRSGGRCEARIPGVCLGPGDVAHHVQLRSAGGDDSAANLLWICHWGCHTWIHNNVKQAKSLGLLRGK